MVQSNHDDRFPALGEIEAELKRLGHKGKYQSTLRSTISTLVVILAVAVLVAVLFLPVVRVTGTSMEPSLTAGDYIVGIKTQDFRPGEICLFYINNKLELKRVIATGGQLVNIDRMGRVSVDAEPLDEPYVAALSRELCDIRFPFVVPQGEVFVMGDNREMSVDSRIASFGCIPVEEIDARMLARVYPFDRIALLDDLSDFFERLPFARR